MSTFTLAPVELTQAGINELYDTFGSGTESTVDGVTKFMPIDEIIARDVVSKQPFRVRCFLIIITC